MKRAGRLPGAFGLKGFRMDNSIYRKELWEMTDDTGPELADTENRKSL